MLARRSAAGGKRPGRQRRRDDDPRRRASAAPSGGAGPACRAADGRDRRRPRADHRRLVGARAVAASRRRAGSAFDAEDSRELSAGRLRSRSTARSAPPTTQRPEGAARPRVLGARAGRSPRAMRQRDAPALHPERPGVRATSRPRSPSATRGPSPTATGTAASCPPCACTRPGTSPTTPSFLPPQWKPRPAAARLPAVLAARLPGDARGRLRARSRRSARTTGC